MNSRSLKISSVIALLIVIAALFIFWPKLSSSQVAPGPSAHPAKAPAEESLPQPHFPVKTEVASSKENATDGNKVALPDVDNSDEYFKEKIQQVLSDPNLMDILIFPNFIRSAVVFIDNLTTKQLPKSALPISPPLDDFPSKGETIYLSQVHFDRYTPYIKFAESVDLNKLVTVYKHLYPLFQQAYTDLGNQTYFNDRVIEVLQILLETPLPQSPIQLEKAVTTYKFIDPELESLSIGQKILLRMGPENSQKMKLILSNLRGLMMHLDQ